ncbi:hypothetical protein ACHAP4_011332 [Fusarium culmorum]
MVDQCVCTAFDPRHVFQTLYQVPVSRAVEAAVSPCKASRPSMTASVLVEQIQEEMTVQFEQFYGLGSTVASSHQEQMCRHKEEWSLIRSDDTCLCCLRRRPQYCLPCRHTFCEVCITSFYPPENKDAYLFNLDVCLLCGASAEGRRIRMRPDTATARVLSLDGGGVRAVVPLEFLRALEELIRLPCPIQRHFDVVFGTSSGALSACALYINGWTVDECIQYLDVLALLSFQKHMVIRLCLFMVQLLPLMPSLVEFVLSLAIGSKYSAKPLETILQDVYGNHRSIMDSKSLSEMGAMLGVTLTTVQDTSTLVATSYNGVGRRPCDGEGQERRGKINPTASYYPDDTIDGDVRFQDGGLTFNNPASIAINEVAALFPDAPEPSIVVSLGTGSSEELQHSKHRFQPRWVATFPARLVRAFFKQADCNRAWKQVVSQRREGQRGTFVRLDVKFNGRQPSLDDTSRLKDIAETARVSALESLEIRQLARCVRAEMFFFELDPARPPQWVNGGYECFGRIACRLEVGTPEHITLMRQLDQGASTFYRGKWPIPCMFLDVYTPAIDAAAAVVVRAYDNPSLEIKLRISSRQEFFDIQLSEGSGDPCHISGSPFTLESLIRQQKLERPFGSASHRKRLHDDEVGFSAQMKRRRLT